MNSSRNLTEGRRARYLLREKRGGIVLIWAVLGPADGKIAEGGAAGREGAFAGGAPPELDDLKFLVARAAPGQVAAAAVGAGFRLLARQWNTGDARGRRHTINSMFSPYHAAHGYRKLRACKSALVRSTDLVGETFDAQCARGFQRCAYHTRSRRWS